MKARRGQNGYIYENKLFKMEERIKHREINIPLDNYVTIVKKRIISTHQGKTHPVEVGELKNLSERNSNRKFN